MVVVKNIIPLYGIRPSSCDADRAHRSMSCKTLRRRPSPDLSIKATTRSGSVHAYCTQEYPKRFRDANLGVFQIPRSTIQNVK
jgi:hypothetical protein